VQKLKLVLAHRAPKTVNVLTVLSTLLKKAVEWGDLDKVRCTIKLLRNPKKTMGCHDYAEYERLLTAAQQRRPEAHLMVLLGGEAGLRLGEIVALEWGDIDQHARRLTRPTVRLVRSRDGPERRAVSSPSNDPAAGKRTQGIPASAVGAGLVFARWTPITRDRVIKAIRGSQRVAGLPQAGVHVLRHTFCSHLAMKGAPARAI